MKDVPMAPSEFAPTSRCFMSRLPFTAAIVLFALTGTASLLAEEKPSDPDTQLLADAKIGTDTASLLAFLRKDTEGEEDLLRIPDLIRDLGGLEFRKREEAARRLVRLGMPAMDALHDAVEDHDRERAERAY